MPSRETARQFPLLRVLAAMFVYRLGKSVASITVPWFVLALTDSAFWVGVSAAGTGIAAILGSVFGGNLTDRAGPKPVIWAAGAAGGMAVVCIAILHSMEVTTAAVVVTLFVLGSLFDAPAMVAQDSRVPELARLARVSLARATASKSMLGHFAVLAGPALAGIAITRLGIQSGLVIIACCLFSASWLAAPVLPGASSRRKPLAPTGFRAMWAGARVWWQDELLRPLTVLTTAFVGIMTPVVAVIAPTMFQQAGRAAADYAAFLSGSGAGAIAGTMIYAAVGPRLSPRWIFAVGFAVYAGVFPLLTLMPSALVLAGLGGVAGLAGGPVAPLFNKLLYERSPARLRGRVIGAYSGIVMVAVPAAVVLAGMGAQRFGAPEALYMAATVAAVVGLISLRLRLYT